MAGKPNRAETVKITKAATPDGRTKYGKDSKTGNSRTATGKK